ncbi:MAG: HAMP domain-containing histidine kinase [Chloroflexi bacterium]|nr:MAG: HAMP domain-containing histidine kinase [Chloroflexota bacterium]TMG42441.1 MAG: HAMP domain-containing histidine kinase [Chloroflexota bacterium]
MLATTKYGTNAVGSLVRFGLLALVPLVALGAVLAHNLNADVQQRYLETSRSSATLIAQVGIQPLLNAQQLGSGMSAIQIAEIDDKLQGAAVSQEVRRIKVWNRSGTIIYSDNHALIGRTFQIDTDLGEALAGESSASITDGHDEEHAGDDLIGPLVQAYVPLVFKGTSSPSGAFELYLPYAPVQVAIDRESNQLYLLLAAGLTLFYASMFPVVLLADRWRRRLLHEAQETALANLAVLERLNRVKSEFLTRISHQFRTALVGIQGFSELIRDSDRLDLAEVKAFASDIYKDAEGLDRAFTDMLELDGIEAGRTTLKMVRVDINQLISGAVEAIRSQNPSHRLAVRLAASVPAVPCDADKIAQVLAILLSNAVKYSPAGSEVVVSSELNARNVEVMVKDRGRGMPLDFDDGLFVGYQRQPSTSGEGTNRAGATGLGLPIARQIVEMHGGRIWFDSTVGQGSEFHFTLPIQLRPSTELQAVARAT